MCLTISLIETKTGSNVIKALEAFIMKWEDYFGVLVQTETYLSFLKIKEMELLAINK